MDNSDATYETTVRNMVHMKIKGYVEGWLYNKRPQEDHVLILRDGTGSPSVSYQRVT